MQAISLSEPALKLSPKPPEGSLLGPQNVLAGTISSLNAMFWAVILFVMLESQPWYVRFQADKQLFQWQVSVIRS